VPHTIHLSTRHMQSGNPTRLFPALRMFVDAGQNATENLALQDTRTLDSRMYSGKTQVKMGSAWQKALDSEADQSPAVLILQPIPSCHSNIHGANDDPLLTATLPWVRGRMRSRWVRIQACSRFKSCNVCRISSSRTSCARGIRQVVMPLT